MHVSASVPACINAYVRACAYWPTFCIGSFQNGFPRIFPPQPLALQWLGQWSIRCLLCHLVVWVCVCSPQGLSDAEAVKLACDTLRKMFKKAFRRPIATKVRVPREIHGPNFSPSALQAEGSYRGGLYHLPPLIDPFPEAQWVD